MKLSEVPIGAVVEVKRVLQSDISPKLRAVGILPGVRIEVIKAAPMGDPRLYKVFNKTISLRDAEADLVEVELIEEIPLPATFVEPGIYKVVNILAGRIARSSLSRCGIIENETIEILPDRRVKTSVGIFDIGFGRLSKVMVTKIRDNVLKNSVTDLEE